MKLAEAVRHSGSQFDGPTGFGVLVQEVEPFLAHSLKLPQGHHPYNGGNLPDERSPCWPANHCRKRITVYAASVTKRIQNRRLSPGVLLEYESLRRCRVRHSLPPVVLDELFGYLVDRQNEDRATVVAQRGRRVPARARICRRPRIGPPQEVAGSSPETGSARQRWVASPGFPVCSPVRDHPSYSAARIGNIAVPARKDMNVSMHHRLACRRPIIEANIETVRRESCQWLLTDMADQFPNRILLG